LSLVFHLVFHEPQIPLNTGSAIRTCAATGTHLHLIEPLGFDLSDAKLRRAGLDYHDLASVTVHPDIDSAWTAISPSRVIAFTTHASTRHSDVGYQPGDALLFGTEATGLPAEVLDDATITAQVRIPMLPGRRSLNLSNSAAIAVYEAWRQNDYAGT
jgi:tRNA (cytidine/uridine-2'-O-)-methyltransferase